MMEMVVTMAVKIICFWLVYFAQDNLYTEALCRRKPEPGVATATTTESVGGLTYPSLQRKPLFELIPNVIRSLTCLLCLEVPVIEAARPIGPVTAHGLA